VSFRIEIDRLYITISGVAPGVVEQAVGGLSDELQRRLGSLQHRHFAARDLADISLAPIQLGARTDAATLRALLAERLVFQLGEVAEGEE
jgi:hypothetical protein